MIYVNPKIINQNETQFEAIQAAESTNAEINQNLSADLVEDIEDSRHRPRPPVIIIPPHIPPNSGASLFNFSTAVFVSILVSINVFIKF